MCVGHFNSVTRGGLLRCCAAKARRDHFCLSWGAMGAGSFPKAAIGAPFWVSKAPLARFLGTRIRAAFGRRRGLQGGPLPPQQLASGPPAVAPTLDSFSLLLLDARSCCSSSSSSCLCSASSCRGFTHPIFHLSGFYSFNAICTLIGGGCFVCVAARGRGSFI